MTDGHFRNYAEIERQILAARQLRAETVAAGIRTFAAFAGAAIRRMALPIAARAPRRAWLLIASDRRAPQGPRG